MHVGCGLYEPSKVALIHLRTCIPVFMSDICTTSLLNACVFDVRAPLIPLEVGLRDLTNLRQKPWEVYVECVYHPIVGV